MQSYTPALASQPASFRLITLEVRLNESCPCRIGNANDEVFHEVMDFGVGVVGEGVS